MIKKYADKVINFSHVAYTRVFHIDDGKPDVLMIGFPSGGELALPISFKEEVERDFLASITREGFIHDLRRF